jgi:hypothetical protein
MTMITNLVGYLASAMVLLTFMAKDIRLLRIIGIFSNIAFIAYGALAWLPPVFCLHLLLLPINVLRLRSLLAEEGCRCRVSNGRRESPRAVRLSNPQKPRRVRPSRCAANPRLELRNGAKNRWKTDR